jgi:hypothetical protein
LQLILLFRCLINKLTHYENDFFVSCILVFTCYSVRAQDPSSSAKFEGQTSFYAELGGPGLLFSANIDRRFKPNSLGWGARAGLTCNNL